jgi:hypothetical protein
MKPPDEVEILSVAVVTEVELMLSESTGVLEARSLSGTVQTSNSPVLVIDPLNPTVKVAVVPAGTILEKMPTPAAVLACMVAETGDPDDGVIVTELTNVEFAVVSTATITRLSPMCPVQMSPVSLCAGPLISWRGQTTPL